MIVINSKNKLLIFFCGKNFQCKNFIFLTNALYLILLLLSQMAFSTKPYNMRLIQYIFEPLMSLAWIWSLVQLDKA